MSQKPHPSTASPPFEAKLGAFLTGDTVLYRTLPGFSYRRLRLMHLDVTHATLIDLDNGEKLTLPTFTYVRRTVASDALPNERVRPLGEAETLTVQAQAGNIDTVTVLRPASQHPIRRSRQCPVVIEAHQETPALAAPFSVKMTPAAGPSLAEDATTGKFVNGDVYLYKLDKDWKVRIYKAGTGFFAVDVVTPSVSWAVHDRTAYGSTRPRPKPTGYTADTWVTDGKGLFLVEADAEPDHCYPLTPHGVDTDNPVDLDLAVHRPAKLTAVTGEVL
jgi:hypothetical protein